nr:fatty acid synthase-like [Onthophagus taurus]
MYITVSKTPQLLENLWQQFNDNKAEMGVQSVLQLSNLNPKMAKKSYFPIKAGDEIVITGMSGKFPDSNDVYHFRDNLFNKVDLVSGDYRRWKPIHPEVPQRTGKLFDIEKFDAGFFGIPKLHAHNMDPMCRLALERIYEALIDAGHHPSDLEGTKTGIYLGCCFSETEKSTFWNNLTNCDPITGCQRSMLAKRLSYHFKLNGAGFVTDTACSSTLFALEHAYRHINEGVSEKAIVCGAHLCLQPIVSLQFARLGVLSQDGSCKSFDDAGNGYARSEGIVAILLEKSKDAKRVYAEIVHSKTNCDGYKEQGITFPSSGMQKVLMKEFYEECQIDPATLSFVEAHGTGTKVGDPEELTTLDEIFCKNRNRPLHIGAVKSSIGHNEPVSGICSIVKVLIGFESGFIPPNINYTTPRKGVEGLEKGRLVVVTEKIPWPDNFGLVGINNFGFGGGNSHVLLRWNKKVKINGGIPNDDLPRLICASARNKDAITSIFDEASKMDSEFIKLIHQVFSKTIPNSIYNGFLIAEKSGEIKRVIKENLIKKKLRIVFNNIDKNWYQLGAKLMEIPPFSGSIQQIHEIINKEIQLNITEILTDQKIRILTQSFLGFIAVQLSLADLIKNLNLDFNEIVGVGFGEFSAAYLDGVLTLKEAILGTYYTLTGNRDKIKEIFANKVLTPKKWVNKQKDSKKFIQPLDYFMEIVSNPIHFEDGSKNYINLVIGEAKNEKSDLVFIRNKSNPIYELLNSLGELSLWGFPSQLDYIYPKISFPVSRGTPMISPLIKWDHSENYTVHFYKNEDEQKSGQRVMHISVRLEEWNFLKGHVIDGRNLFPATGYLALVWECYAIIIGKLISDTQMVFEDVKFLRATNIPKEETLSLKVNIQLQNKTFEILEGDNLLVTGTVYPLVGDENKTNHPEIILSGDEEETAMNQRDIYKELRLRGYQYSNKFMAINSFNFHQNKAIISWEENFIAFMDNMLQVQLISQDTRNLYVPTSIKKIIINGPQHIKSAITNNNLIPVIYHEDLSTIKGGGIEIIGLGANSIARKKPADPVLESYKFTPYHDKLQKPQAIRSFVQTILENSTTIKVKAVELIAEEDGEPLLPLVQESLGDLPLIQAELKILSKNENLDLPGITVEDKSLNTETHCLILITKSIFENPTFLSSALKATKDASGFIISQENRNSPIKEHPQIQILSSYENKDNKLILIKESSQYVEKLPIKITEINDFSWIENLHQKTSSNSVVLYSEKIEINGLLGLTNCLRREPSGVNISLVLVTENAPQFNVKNQFYKTQLEKNLAINIFKDGKWGCYRHFLLDQIESVQKEHCYVNVTSRGDLSTLRWIEGALSSTSDSEPEAELVNIHYASLNFRDIMTATGKLSPDAITKDRILQECTQGFEFSGCLASNPLKRVMGTCISGALSTMVMADSKLIWPIPKDWSYEDAATIPVVYGTVYYAFFMRGKIRRGQSILIHSGTGGVGQAAINIATNIGCKIFTTVGTKEKRDFIQKNFPQINSNHIGDSRSTSFEQMIFKETNGKGVDFVLNSLAEEKLLASVRCLAKNGTFLEIGKFDLANDNELCVSLLKQQARFEGIMLDQLFTTGIDRFKEMLSNLIRDGLLNGSIKPLVRTVFNMDQIEEAFRFMASGKHIGKVVIKVRGEAMKQNGEVFEGIPRLSCTHTGCYIIIGGLGGFGLELADWLITRGVKHLVLTSRTGIKNGYQRFRLNIFKNYGVETHIRSDDITTKEGCRTLLSFAETLGPVEGIFNLAVVLKDALFENQTVESFEVSLKPKAYATQYLDEISRGVCVNLKYFVVFSSVSCGRGNAGQTNYGMANSIMERICERRKKEGFPALAIQWGAIGDVGLVADMQENHKELVIGGTLQQRISNCLQVLDRLLKQKEPIVSSMVVAEKRGGVGANNIFDAVLNIIGVTNLKAVSHYATFPELGMDSMMAIEIKQTLEKEYEVFLNAQDIRNMTISKLKELVSEQSDVASKPNQNELQSDLPEDIKLLFRHIGNEETSNEKIVNLKSKTDSNNKIIAFPGIEGMAGIYETISKELTSDLMCFQFCAENHSESIEEIAQSLTKIVLSSISCDNFTIIAYSFGCVVATELMFILESLGKTGKAFFIDGAPELMTCLVKKHFPFNDDEIFETTLLCILMTRYMPFDAILKHKSEIIKRKSYEDKIKYIMSVSPSVNHSENYVIEMCKAALSRLKAIRKYEPRPEKLNSKIILGKPSIQSLEIAEDYNLSLITTEKVDVKIFEGNHVTILENNDLIEEINSFLLM